MNDNPGPDLAGWADPASGAGEPGTGGGGEGGGTVRLTIESTDVTTTIDRVEVRVWEGTTADGIPCKVFVHRIAVANDQDAAAFDRELREQLPPGRHFPLWMIL